MSESVFGSDLAVADTIENFFSWKDQALVGTEVVDRAACQILESKPGSGDFSIYGRVRSWVAAMTSHGTRGPRIRICGPASRP